MYGVGKDRGELWRRWVGYSYIVVRNGCSWLWAGVVGCGEPTRLGDTKELDLMAGRGQDYQTVLHLIQWDS